MTRSKWNGILMFPKIIKANDTSHLKLEKNLFFQFLVLKTEFCFGNNLLSETDFW